MVACVGMGITVERLKQDGTAHSSSDLLKICEDGSKLVCTVSQAGGCKHTPVCQFHAVLEPSSSLTGPLLQSTDGRTTTLELLSVGWKKMEQGWFSDASSVHDLIKKSQLLCEGPPALHCLYTTRSDLNKDGKIRKWTFGQKSGYLQNNTILMVGETGTGKTTLINTMVNYFLGVKFKDKVWFEITEELKRDQTQTQTSEVTVYEIISEERLSSLTIIDTPGYGNTRGIKKDMDIARNLHELFLHDAGVKDLDAVCLVLKANQNRVSDTQRYSFEAVLSLFGKDIEDIIVLCITHSDGKPPTNALQAIREEKIPCCYDDEDDEPVHFLFNNRQSEKRSQRYEHVSRSAWEMGERSMEEFFESLKSRQRKSVTLTVSVLNERMQLKACVESLKENIRYREAKQNELTGVQKTLTQPAFRKVETEHKEKQKMKEEMMKMESRLKTLLAENEEKKKRLVRDAYMSILKLSEIALKPDSAFTIQYLDFLIPRVEEVGAAEWAQKLRNIQKTAAKESPKSVVGFLKMIDLVFALRLP
ncbi:hypothetical protein NFI96_003928 [Prochilodus magdalenae]|nr:hypothetical protein NFI96_003928 [Prochilodus magdalenae]